MALISRIAENLVPSATGAMNARQIAMKQSGINDVISLSVGEPDFRTPENICMAAKDAMDKGFTHYTPNGGIKPLKEAVVKKFESENHLNYKLSQVCVTTGAKLSIFAALLAMCNPGDEVIVPSPCWVSYTEQIKMVGATPVVVPMSFDEDFQLNSQRIEAAITPKTKLVIINSPNNPTGVVYSRKSLEGLENVVRKHNLMVISDEIYEKMVYEKDYPFISFAEISDYAYNNTVIINGVSKAYAMTGWRIGYCAGPESIVKAIEGLVGHITSGANTIAQYAAVEAISGPQDSVKDMVRQFAERREYMFERLSTFPGFKCFRAEGAFYLFADISSYFGKELNGKKILNSVDFCEAILENTHVGTIPGISFEAPEYIRFSYANSLENIKEALDRIERFLKNKFKMAEKSAILPIF